MIGNRGAYYLGLTDLDSTVLTPCLALLEGAAVFLKKLPEITCAEPEEEKRLQIEELHHGFDLITGALADLEIIFPLHWNVIVIHWLLHQLEEVLRFGSFSAVNMLLIERYHVRLKLMFEGGTVNPMRTLSNKMSAFHDAEYWRLVNHNKPGSGKKNKRLSSIASNVAAAVVERKTEAEALGAGVWQTLSSPQFKLLLETWAREIGHNFDVQILDKYKAFIAQGPQKRQRTANGARVDWWTAEKWRDWFEHALEIRSVSGRWAPWQRRFLNITGRVQTYRMATVGSAMFCTKRHSDNRKFDNSSIEQLFEHEDGARRDTCFGRIQGIFTHTMPWSKEVGKELTGFTKRVVIEADWFVPVFGPRSRSGLLQVAFDEEWSGFSRMGFLINMYAHNIALWPSGGVAGASERDTVFDVVRYHYFDTEE